MIGPDLGKHTLTFLSFALLVGSAIDTGLENLIFALEFILKVAFKLELLGLTVLPPLTRFESANLFFGLVCCALAHFEILEGSVVV